MSGPVRVGLIADIQYADADDGTDFQGKEHRHFRNALEIAKAAVGCFNSADVAAVINLGDIIDGCNARMGAGASAVALRSVLDVLNRSPAKRYDLIGNHELYNMPRSSLSTSGLCCTDPSGRTYYSAHLGDHWEAVFLDPYEVSMIGLPEGSLGHREATSLLTANNPSTLKQGSGDWFAGLPLEKYRWVPYNGGVSPAQLRWLDGALSAAKVDGRKILVFTHIPLFAKATKPETIVWNCEEVLDVLHRHRDAVVAVFAGHDHGGGYAVDAAGVHHVTMCSPMTADVGGDCFAVLECHPSGFANFIAHGRACVESATEGKGKCYPSLVLAKNSENRPEGSLEGSADGVEQLVGMGFPRDQASEMLRATNGSVELAINLLCQ